MYVLLICEKFGTKLFQHFRQENLLGQEVTICDIWDPHGKNCETMIFHVVKLYR